MNKHSQNAILLLTSEIIENDFMFMNDEEDCKKFNIDASVQNAIAIVNQTKNKINKITKNKNMNLKKNPVKVTIIENTIPDKLNKRKRNNIQDSLINQTKSSIKSNISKENTSNNYSKSYHQSNQNENANTSVSKLSKLDENSKLNNLQASKHIENKDLMKSFQGDCSAILNNTKNEWSFGREDRELAHKDNKKDNKLYSPDTNLSFSLLDISNIDIEALLKANNEVSILLDNSQSHKPNDKISDHMNAQLEELFSKDLKDFPVLRSVNLKLDNKDTLVFIYLTATIKLKLNTVFTLYQAYQKDTEKTNTTIIGFNEFLETCFDQDNIDGFIERQNQQQEELLNNQQNNHQNSHDK